MREAREARRRRRRRRAWRAGVAGAVALGLVGGGVAFAASRGAGDRYRTATAARAAVAQTIQAVGTVGAADRADVAFTVAGTLADVAVGVGDVVAAGDVLATVDPTDLQAEVDQAAADLADARDQLEADLDSQTGATTTTSAPAATSTPAATPSADGTASAGHGGNAPGGGQATPDPAVARAVATVQRAQADLLAQVGAVDAALATSQADVATSDAACDLSGSVEPTSAPTAAPTTEPTDEPVTEPPSPPTGGPTDAPTTDPATPTVEQLQACQVALTTVQQDQAAVDAAQARLLELASALDAAVAEAQRAIAAAATTSGGATGTASGTPAATTETPTTSGAAGTTGGSPPGSASAAVASAADVLADRAAISLAEAKVAVARAQLGRATLTSPIAGTVGAVGLAAGDDVTAGSTEAVITVLGGTGHTVTATVGLSVIDTLAVGQHASVVVASADGALRGAVSSIGVLDVSSGSTPEYTVVVTLDDTDAELFEGASAHVTITVAGDEATLTVPTSAVHVSGGDATVTVVRGGATEDVTVDVGAVGTELTEIRSGLDEGDEVVLADLRRPLDGDDGTDAGLTGLGGSSRTSLPGGDQRGPMGGPPTG